MSDQSSTNIHESTLMIKRVAAAIVEALQNDRDEDIRAGIGAIYGFGGEYRIADFEKSIARAALRAMRDLIEEVLNS